MSVEARRGCGFRKVGGLYLVADALGEACHRLPFELRVCPTCGAGVKQSRGWTWIEPTALFGGRCSGWTSGPKRLRAGTIGGSLAGREHCLTCPVCRPEHFNGRAGLLWVGGSFYGRVRDFEEEALKMGISRRLKSVPRSFFLGATWVLLGHPAVRLEADPENPLDVKPVPGIFSAFRPKRVELLIWKSEATPERLAELEESGVTPVIVPDGDRDHMGTVYDRDPEVAEGSEG